jgi:copper chaperone CopZ
MLWRIGSITAILFAFTLISAPLRGEPVKHQVTGLFMPEREADLREVIAKLPGIKLVSVDFKNAEAVFDYEVKKFGKPDQAMKALDQMLQQASRGAFGIKPLCKTPADKLTLIVIPVSGLDCKACSYAAYEAVYRLDGVERATASFRDGKVTALVDPSKTDRAKLETALKKRGVTIKSK